MILSGYRRAYAAKPAGLLEVPCIVKEYDDIMVANIVIQSNLLNREKDSTQRKSSRLQTKNRCSKGSKAEKYRVTASN